MASPYDESLLASAPAATKKQLQHGYNSDLLAEKPVAATPPASNSRQNSRLDLEAYPQDGRSTSAIPPLEKPTPFYRTKKGIIILIVAFVVIVAAVVGGAVGGTKKKSSNSNVGVGVGGTAPSGTQGVGGKTPSSTSSGASHSTASSTSTTTSPITTGSSPPGGGEGAGPGQ